MDALGKYAAFLIWQKQAHDAEAMASSSSCRCRDCDNYGCERRCPYENPEDACDICERCPKEFAECEDASVFYG